jgi:hypothetical protein
LSPSSLPANGLIASLPRTDRDRVTGACEHAELDFGKPLCNPGDTIRHVYFPTNSYISLITPPGTSESLEVGMVGNEGMFGITLLLNVKTSPLLGLVQGGGPALRMSASRFAKVTSESEAFKQTLNRYLYVLTAQIAQTAACNRFHQLDQRMARWLLMTQDRAHSDTFRLTHQFLAYMLGVRRAGITGRRDGAVEAAHPLRSRGAHRSGSRRPQAVSCSCHGAQYHLPETLRNRELPWRGAQGF